MKKKKTRSKKLMTRPHEFDRVFMTLSNDGKVGLVRAKAYVGKDPLFPDLVFDESGAVERVFSLMVFADMAVSLDGSSKMVVVKDRFDRTPRIESIR